MTTIDIKSQVFTDVNQIGKKGSTKMVIPRLHQESQNGEAVLPKFLIP